MNASHSMQPIAAENKAELAVEVANPIGPDALAMLGQTSLYEHDQDLSDRSIARSWEEQGVVKMAPTFAEQVEDSGRRTTFRVSSSANSYKRLAFLPEGYIEGRVSEAEGLREVHGLLRGYIDYHFRRMARGTAEQKEFPWLAKAYDMKENLTFIGESEYKEATAGIAAGWKSYLDEDPERKICVLTEAGKLERHVHARKSDDYLKNQVLENFTDEELERYSGRIVDRLEDMDMGASPDKGRVILLDDWTISGKQMREQYHHQMRKPLFRKFADGGRVEINLIVASADRIRNGLHIVPGQPEKGTIPVRAYYQAHYAATAHKAHSSYITGVHSPVNCGFSEVSRRAAKTFIRASKGEKPKPPALVRLVPDYRDQLATIHIGKDGMRRLSRQELVSSRARLQSGVLAMGGETA
jgi:hypothetical protein